MLKEKEKKRKKVCSAMRAYLEESDQIKKDSTGKVTLKGRTGINRQKEEKRVFRHRNSQCKIHVEREDGK